MINQPTYLIELLECADLYAIGGEMEGTGLDGSVLSWDTATWARLSYFTHFPDGEYTVWNDDDTLRYASAGAWRRLGWETTVNGKLDRLPAELFGSLPLPPDSTTEPPASI